MVQAATIATDVRSARESSPEMGGSVDAIATGVNFPKLLYDWKMGRTLEATTTYRLEQRLRWLTSDIWVSNAFSARGDGTFPTR